MEKVLSQDEVDALLMGLSNGEIESGPQAKESTSGLNSYDFTNQERIIRGRMPTLEIINERFSRFYGVSLSSALKKVIEISVISIEIKKFSEFIKKIPLPSNLNIIKLDPLRGHSLFVIDARLVYLLVDHFFGGSGQTHVKTEGRGFTSIEQRIIKNVVSMGISDLEKAWSPVYPIKVQSMRTEMNPQFVGIVAPTEVVIAITYKVEIETETKEMYLCIPYSTIEPIKEKLYGGYQSDQLEVDQRWVNLLKDQIKGCNINLLVELGRSKISVKDLLNLKIGDVIILEKSASEELPVYVDGKVKYKGYPGIYRGNQSLQISSKN